MTIAKGQRLPFGSFMTPGADGPEKIATDALFQGKTAVLIGVPGAFTPTCSLNHLPTFIDKNDALRSKGVEEIAVISVNDPFVVKAWRDSTGGEGKVTYLADPKGEYIQSLGLDMDIPGLGGLRSKRFCMLVKDNVVQELMVEDSPGESGKTDADALLAKL
ncbi:peroxiredoxin [Notoacmeibacter sp. MSK16QG-6]|uniref:peroxiredoxin n=1 Tax=Notoacmeibacter sp. MSK16QG-6 TaxID=2957982 RepID=UPI00209FFEC3|nr:redoxin family protein [Notoacmeibacter sp. MSK16QG-6]MCP1198216.1 redoxin family protein [Notoacmeibacter sp. MSK16QG-6]